jgi:hypothetical protein
LRKREETPVNDEIYERLRALAFAATPETAQLPGDPFGLIMETAYREGVVTVVAMSDGSTSLYNSKGGAIIGAGQHPKPNALARQLVREAKDFARLLEPSGDHELPALGQTRFYLLTRTGALSAKAPELDLAENRLPLSPLFHAVHQVIAAVIEAQQPKA